MRSLREGLKRMAGAAVDTAEALGILAWLERTGERPGLLRVLTYHRVDEPDARPRLHPGLLSATPEAFATQMSHLDRHYQVVSVEEVIAARRAGNELPPRSVVITFDDAYRDFAANAWPVLRELGFPVTLFVPTGYPDRKDRCFWWDRLYDALMGTECRDELFGPLGVCSLNGDVERLQTFRRLRERVKELPHDEAMNAVDETCTALGQAPTGSEVLGWDALRTLSAEGVTLASHTRNHPLLNRISVERMRCELRDSMADLEREIGIAPPVFAYPAGGVSEAAVRVLAEEGFELAFTTRRSVADLHHDHPLKLGRIPVGGRTTPALLRLQLSPWSMAWRGRSSATAGTPAGDVAR